MSKTAKMTHREILEAEMAADARRKTRNTGFAKMKERDQAIAHLSNGVVIRWRPVGSDETKEMFSILASKSPSNIYVLPSELNIPAGKFILTFNGQDILFDAEEFRKWLRWV